MRKSIKNNNPHIHGHRGARGRCPENTLAGVKYAIESGVDGIEVDLCVSQDNFVVIHHDLTLSPHFTRDLHRRWISVPTPLRNLTFEQLSQYDVGTLRPGSGYTARFPEQVSIPNTRIPSLDQFIEYVLEYSDDKTIINLELKSNPMQPDLIPAPEYYVGLVLNSIRRYDISHRTFFQSFDWRLMRIVGEHEPNILRGLLTDLQLDGNPRSPIKNMPSDWTDSLNLADFDDSVPRMIASTGATVWSSNYADLTPALIHEARGVGLSVCAWTVNEISDMKNMIDWGVEVITTDYPDRLANILRNGDNI